MVVQSRQGGSRGMRNERGSWVESKVERRCECGVNLTVKVWESE